VLHQSSFEIVVADEPRLDQALTYFLAQSLDPRPECRARLEERQIYDVPGQASSVTKKFKQNAKP
jgi:hypothetical protein